jgi:hypothetical protein
MLHVLNSDFVLTVIDQVTLHADYDGLGDSSWNMTHVNFSVTYREFFAPNNGFYCGSGNRLALTPKL